jgi:hypothetical protein
VHPSRTVVVKALTEAEAAVISGTECDGDEMFCETFIGKPVLSSSGSPTLIKTDGNLTVVNKRCQKVKENQYLNAYQDVTGVWITDDTRDFCQARWIKFRFTPGEETSRVTPTAHFDGQNPALCSDDGAVDVEFPMGQPLCETDVMAFYDPNTDKYQALTTPAAMLGESETHEIVTDIKNDDCGVELVKMEYKMFPNSCNPTPIETKVELGTSTPILVALSSENCGEINYAWIQARVFLCDSVLQFADFPLNFNNVRFVTGASFGAPTCLGNATWTFNTVTNDWDLTTPCSLGCESVKPAIPVPLPSGTITQTSSCDAPINGQCGLNLTLNSPCASGGSATTVHVPLSLEPVDVVYDVVDNTAEISIYKKTVYVCNWEPANDGSPIPIVDCATGSGGY